jgi:hypothetical protein
MSRRADRLRKIGFTRRTRPAAKYIGTKKPAHENLSRRNLPRPANGPEKPDRRRTSEAMHEALRNTRTLAIVRIAGEILLPKTIT